MSLSDSTKTNFTIVITTSQLRETDGRGKANDFGENKSIGQSTHGRRVGM
jgi:hypothetical protein